MYLEYVDDFVYFIGFCTSSLCSIMLVIAWCAMPRWRTLQNYIYINQIVTGTVFFISICSIQVFPCDACDNSIADLFRHYSLYLSLCWSLCGSVVAYIRLVLQYTTKISYEKRISTVFTYAVFGLISAVTDGIIPKLCDREIDWSYWDALYDLTIFEYLVVYILATVIFSVYISIAISVLSCCKQKISTRNISHVLSLIGVAVLCDSTLLGTYLLQPIALQWDKIWFYYISVIVLTQRLTLQTVYLLFRRSSRILCKIYVKKWRNRFVNNNIELL